MFTLHDFMPSGNGFKCRLIMRFLGQPFRYVQHDIVAGQTRTPDFLKTKSPNGRIPVLELEDGSTLWESGAILTYLAEGSSFLPDERFERAQVYQWMFFEQYSHEPNVATPRFWKTELPEMTELQAAMLPGKMEQGYAALQIMEDHLSGPGERPWFVGRHPSIADIALYAYTHVAPEGGFDLSRFPALTAWMERFTKIPGYVPITHTVFE